MLDQLLEEKFKNLLDYVAARLSTLGFKLSRSTLRIQKGENLGLIEFQRSTKSTKQRMLFTLNLAIVIGRLLDSGPSELRAATVMDAHVRERAGAFLPGRPDKWWEINPASDTEELGTEIVALLLEKVLPSMTPLLCTSNLIKLWESGYSPGLTDGQRVTLLHRLRSSSQGDVG